ncbi:MAG: 3-deoxy-D-manno-octulosonic acid transferase [Candidatus Acidiferrum sp.]
MFFVYSLLLGLAALVLTPYWLLQSARHGKYLANLGQRLGFSFPALKRASAERVQPTPAGSKEGAIWLHAVSVGEVLSSVTLARQLKAAHPGRPLIVSTTTITGQALARERLNFADGFLYFPLDWAFAVRRSLDAVRPAAIVIVETEIWPNFLRECAQRNLPVAFVSGRISDRSFARYQRYLSLAGFYLRPLLRKTLSFASVFLMQSQSDAERIRALGAPAERVTVAGNLKYDLALPAPTPISKWLAGEAARLGRSPVIVAGSVVATEEPLALIAFGTLQGEYPKALLVLAPRKPERFDAAAQFLKDFHSKFVRRSTLDVPAPLQTAASNGALPGRAVQLPGDVKVILLDSIGELASLYGIADYAFVGGSLVTSGGHNILEPAAFGKIPVFGPSMENFSEMASRFLAAGAAVQVPSPEDAGVAWIELEREPERRKRMGARAQRLVEESRGATERAVAEITKLLAPSSAKVRG